MPIHRAFAVSAAKGIYCRQYTKLFAGNICNSFFIQSPYTAATFDFACFEFVSCNRAGAAAVATAQPTGTAFSVFRSAVSERTGLLLPCFESYCVMFQSRKQCVSRKVRRRTGNVQRKDRLLHHQEIFPGRKIFEMQAGKGEDYGIATKKGLQHG